MIIEYFEITFKKTGLDQEKTDKHKVEIQVIGSFYLLFCDAIWLPAEANILLTGSEMDKLRLVGPIYVD